MTAHDKSAYVKCACTHDGRSNWAAETRIIEIIDPGYRRGPLAYQTQLRQKAKRIIEAIDARNAGVVVTCSECGGQLRTDDPHWRHKPGCSQTQLWNTQQRNAGMTQAYLDPSITRLAEALSVNLDRVVAGDQMKLVLEATLEQEGLTVVPVPAENHATNAR